MTQTKTSTIEIRSTEVDSLLAKTRQLLSEGKPLAALQILPTGKGASPWLLNARGVCQLRIGETSRAIDVFRSLSLEPNQNLRDDVPAVFKVNYATALLVDGNLLGFEFVLDGLRNDVSPASVRLRDAFRKYRASLTFFQKLKWMMGSPPQRPAIVAAPYGEIE